VLGRAADPLGAGWAVINNVLTILGARRRDPANLEAGVKKKISTSRRKRPRSTSAVARRSAKPRPQQQRSIETFELILRVTATLLGEIGVESLSTNLICKHAGLSPPALYRYFPDKYAILRELGARLMDRQNQSYLAWLAEQPKPGTPDSREQAMLRLQSMQTAINAITFDFPAAVWIMRALRAVPSLQTVRLESHESVAEESFGALLARFPHADRSQLRLATRLATEVMYSATEMVLDNPDLDSLQITAEVSEMVVRYFDKFAENEIRHADEVSMTAAASESSRETARTPEC
jgi:AcrR family transcriptional regulator